MNINGIQWLLIAIAALGAISGGSAQMNDLFGPTIAKDVASAASFLSSIISAIMLPLTGQTATLKAASNIQGVEPIKINASASRDIAKVAVDPSVDNVEPVPTVATQVAAIAKGA